MNKTIRFFHRRWNYSSATADRLRCEKTLSHSLRLPLKEADIKKLEWNEALVKHNRIWLNGEILVLDELDNTSRLELLYAIAPQPKVRNQQRLQTQRRQYRAKLKKAIQAEQKKGNTDAAVFLEDVLQTKGHVSYSRIELFARLAMQRKKQRITMLEKYLNAHNQLVNKVPSANSVYVQEGLFKIPHRWQVGADVIGLEEYIAFTAHFLGHYFPDYEIKAIIAHDDERAVEQNTGLHTHYYLSGENSQTGKYDLHKRQIQVVNRYIKKFGSKEDVLPENGDLSRQQSKVFGAYFQRLVLDFANKHLLEPKGLTAELAPASERRSAQRKEMNRQAKLPKAERSHNYHTYLVEQAQNKLKEAEHQLVMVKEAQCQAERQLDMVTGELMKAKMEFSVVSESKDTVQAEVRELQAEKHRLSAIIDEMTPEVMRRISIICKDIYLSIRARDRGLQKKATVFIDRVRQALFKLPPATGANTEELLEELDLIADEKSQDLVR